MKPAAFRYFAPDSLDQALALLAEHGDDAKVLAGGQSLVPTMNFRLAQPAVLVDLNRIPGLAYVRAAENDGGVAVGAMTRQRAVERDPLIAERVPLVAETLPYVAHPQIRNRGTFGGSIAHADPAAELPAVALTLGATLRLQSVRGGRSVSADAFFTDLFETDCCADEMVVEVVLPRSTPGTGWAFREMARRHGDYALVGVAVQVRLGADRRCQEARIALLSVGPGPVFARRACTALVGARGDNAELEVAARLAAHEDIDPSGDIHASPAYRRHLAAVLTVQALAQAFARANASFSE